MRQFNKLSDCAAEACSVRRWRRTTTTSTDLYLRWQTAHAAGDHWCPPQRPVHPSRISFCILRQINSLIVQPDRPCRQWSIERRAAIMLVEDGVAFVATPNCLITDGRRADTGRPRHAVRWLHAASWTSQPGRPPSSRLSGRPVVHLPRRKSELVGWVRANYWLLENSATPIKGIMKHSTR